MVSGDSDMWMGILTYRLENLHESRDSDSDMKVQIDSESDLNLGILTLT